MSDPAVWGPSLWRILHTLAERLGSQKNSMLIADEQRAWMNFLHSVENAIPCKRCKDHYKRWTKEHRIDSAVVQDTARKWVWGLHTEINGEQNKVGPEFSEMGALYGERSSSDLTRDVDECIGHLTTAAQRTHIAPTALRTFKYTLSFLRKFTG